MKYCENCGNKLQENSEYCTNCGKKINNDTFKSNRENVKTINIIIILIAIVIIVIIAINFLKDNSNLKDEINNLNNSNYSSNNDSLILEEGAKGYADSSRFSYYIEGYIKNTSYKKFDYVQVIFNTYDSEGNTIGSCLDNINGLEANGRWKFEAICSGDAKSVASFKLDEISNR